MLTYLNTGCNFVFVLHLKEKSLLIDLYSLCRGTPKKSLFFEKSWFNIQKEASKKETRPIICEECRLIVSNKPTVSG